MPVDIFPPLDIFPPAEDNLPAAGKVMTPAGKFPPVKLTPSATIPERFLIPGSSEIIIFINPTCKYNRVCSQRSCVPGNGFTGTQLIALL